MQPTVSYVQVTFASGALADWMPAYLSRLRGLDLVEAGSLVGTATVVGGLGGTLLGGWAGDAISPPIVGVIADTTGSLALGMTLVPVTLFAGALVWRVGGIDAHLKLSVSA